MKMIRTKLLFGILLVSILMQPAVADDTVTKLRDKFKAYTNGVVQKVKNAESPDQKRAVLNESFNKMLTALDKVESMMSLTEEEAAFVASTRERYQGYRNELNGENGFERVSDSELNNFANYVQQDIEQADRTVTLSLTSLLLIIIIVILLA
jgi:hypothetical protein